MMMRILSLTAFAAPTDAPTAGAPSGANATADASPPADQPAGDDPAAGVTSQAMGPPIAVGSTPDQPPVDSPMGEPPLGHGVTPEGPIAGGTLPGQSQPPVGSAPSAPGVGAAAVTSSPGEQPVGDSWSEWEPFLAFGLGITLVAAVAWLWARPRAAPQAVVALPAGVSMLPQPGLFGPGTPSLSSGMLLWIVDGEQPDVVAPLLATLAAHHRVLLVAPVDREVPQVHGGPVFHSTNLDPDHIADAADSLSSERGLPVAVVIVNPAATPQQLLDYVEVAPTGGGGVLIVAEDVELKIPKLRSSASAAGWTFRLDTLELSARASPAGFDVRPVPVA